jgi:hypothetical protein
VPFARPSAQPSGSLRAVPRGLSNGAVRAAASALTDPLSGTTTLEASTTQDKRVPGGQMSVHFIRAMLERPKRRQAARELRAELEKARIRFGPTIGVDLPATDPDAVLIGEEALRMFPDLVLLRTGDKVMLTFRGAWEANYAAAARAVLDADRLTDHSAIADLKLEHEGKK